MSVAALLGGRHAAHHPGRACSRSSSPPSWRDPGRPSPAGSTPSSAASSPSSSPWSPPPPAAQAPPAGRPRRPRDQRDPRPTRPARCATTTRTSPRPPCLAPVTPSRCSTRRGRCPPRASRWCACRRSGVATCPGVQAIADLLEPLDRAIRNLRVLVRRAAIATWREEAVPTAYLRLLDALAETSEDIARELGERRLPTNARVGLQRIGEASAVIDPSAGLSGEVMRAQIRSMVVDLLMLTGHAARRGARDGARVDDDRPAGRLSPAARLAAMSSRRSPHLPPVWLMALALVAVAANLRTAMASVPPLTDVDRRRPRACPTPPSARSPRCRCCAWACSRRSRSGSPRGWVPPPPSRLAIACVAVGLALRLRRRRDVAPVCRDVRRRGGHRHRRHPAPGPGQGALPARTRGAGHRPLHARDDGRRRCVVGPVGAAARAGWGRGRRRWVRGRCSRVVGVLAWVPVLTRPCRGTAPRTPRSPRAVRLPWRHAHRLARRGLPRRPVGRVLLDPGLAGAVLHDPGLGPDPRGLPALGVHRRPSWSRGCSAPALTDQITDRRVLLLSASVLGLLGQAGLWLAPAAAPWVWAIVAGLRPGRLLRPRPGPDGRLRRHPGGQRPAGRDGVLLQLHAGVVRPGDDGCAARPDRRVHRDLGHADGPDARPDRRSPPCCGPACARST